MFQSNVRVLSPLSFVEISLPFETTKNGFSTVARSSVGRKSFGLSYDGNQYRLNSVSPCDHICRGLFGLSGVGLIKRSPRPKAPIGEPASHVLTEFVL